MAIKSKIAALSTIAAGTALSVANAATITIPAEVQETVESAQTAIITAGGYLIVLAVVAMALRWIKGLFF